ncbi:MAG: B-box zinc finger protein [Planctomycetota bacterium]
MALKAQTCANHPERPGKAVCMKCRKTVCLECATLWDGINYCVTCLKQTRAATGKKSSLVAWSMMVLAVIALFLGGSFILVWSATIIAKMF